MNCPIHPDSPVVAYCRTCGQPLCTECRRIAAGTVYCQQHLPAIVPPSPSPPPSTFAAGSSPGLAFLLGLIPGVGAVYNGQYAKGIVHVVIFGLLISLTTSEAVRGFEPLFGMLIAIFYIYMPFEAYHTARRRRLGEVVDEFSSILPLRSHAGRFPAGPILLIALGLLFLLHNLELLRIERLLRYWPVLLIGLGVYMLYCRLSGYRKPGAKSEEHQDVNP
ncbi:MAG: B-box zinc finger protein [Bryobacteraceae bacterium]|nr:B-box zinc finger protein [Bryobacteraceae bacterium]